MKHPKIACTEEGGATPFIHGRDTRSEATISLVGNDPDVRDKAVSFESLIKEQHEYEILSAEELEQIYLKKEKETK